MQNHFKLYWIEYNTTTLHYNDKIFNDRQASLIPALFYYEAMLLEHVQNVAWHCLAEISSDVPEKDVAWMAVYVAPKPVRTFQHLRCHHRYAGYPWCHGHYNTWRTQCPWFPKTIWNVDSSGHSTLFHFASVHLRWSWAQRSRCHLWMSLIWLSLCIVEF